MILNSVVSLVAGLLLVAVLYGCLYFFLWLCQQLGVWRDEFRETVVSEWKDYTWRRSQRDDPKVQQRWSFEGAKWWEIAWDVAVLILLALAWLIIEVLAILGALIMGAFMLVTAYALAKDFRDWWHAGHRR